MDIGIEISVKLTEHQFQNAIISDLKNTAFLYECSSFYYDYEIGGKTTTNYMKRNHYIISVLFENGKPQNISGFIKYVDSLHKIYLECVYENNIPYNIIFCSSYYRKHCLNKNITNYESIKKNSTRMYLKKWLDMCELECGE
jgi:hypothetical protein